MSSRGKRRKTGKAGGRKRKAGGSSSSSVASPSNLTTVKCDGHAAKLLASIDGLRHSHPELCDLRIRPSSGQGAEVPAHSLIMSAASPYVHSKLTRWRDAQEGGSGSSSSSSSASSSSSSSSASVSTTADDDAKLITITIPELDAAGLNAAVHFAYTGTVALDPENKDAALPLIAGFQLLDMEDAVETVAEWVGSTLDPTTALRVRHTAESLHMGVLKARADLYIDENFEAVTKTEEWKMLPAAAVEEVLTRDELRPAGEINVFHALVRWGRGGEGEEGGAAGGGGGESKEGDQEEGREAQFADLLGRCVRASLLGSDELSVVVLMEPMVANSLPAVQVMMRVLQERAAAPSNKAQFASPEPLCRRRGDAGVVKIFAVGGQFTRTLNSVECFDPSTGQWDAVGGMGAARFACGAAVLDGKLYATGGCSPPGNMTLRSVECFDPNTGQWSAVSDMIVNRTSHSVAAVDGKLYALGGHSGDGVHLGCVESFDPSTGRWSEVADMISARGAFGVAVLGGKLYAVGGDDHDGDFVRSVECFDPSTGMWSAVANMTNALRDHAVAVVGGKLYVVGGYNIQAETLSSVECFDPLTGLWSAVADMSAVRNCLGVAAVDGKLYAVGGQVGTGPALSSVESFDSSTGQWSAVADMGTPRTGAAMAALECPKE